MEGLSRLKTQELFVEWLALEETATQVDEWLRQASEGSLEPPRDKISLGDMFHKKPSSPPQQFLSPPGSSSPKSHHILPSPLRGLKAPIRLRQERARSASLEDEEALLIDRWRNQHDGDLGPLPFLRFAPFAADVCDLPTIAGPLIFAKATTSKNDRRDNDDDEKVTLDQFLQFWRRHVRGKASRPDRMFAVLAKDGAKSLTQSDLGPLLRYVVTTHPGLAFLAEHGEFQAKYSSTVITRLFYRANLSRTGTISKREFRDAEPSIVDALFKLESTDDVNAETGYFSYEHFYVLYCQFWELDQDKDAKLTRTDLLKYGGHRLSRAIVDRVFDAAPRPFADGKCGATLRRKANLVSSKRGKFRRSASSNQPFLAMSSRHRAHGSLTDGLNSPDLLAELAAAAAARIDDDDLDDDERTNGELFLQDDDDPPPSGFFDDHDAGPKGLSPSSIEEDAMTYEDFVYFMLSEEDKGNEASLRYWFTCVDVDGDGVVDARDAKHFYDVQAQRMECLGHEVVPLDDVLCQMADLLNADETDAAAAAVSHPKLPPRRKLPQDDDDSSDDGRSNGVAVKSAQRKLQRWRSRKRRSDPMCLRLEVADFLQPSKIRVAGVFFDALFSLDKFVAFEQRDPFAERLKRDDPFDTEWERFAAQEYSRLATEDDDDDDDGSGASDQHPGGIVSGNDIDDDDDDDDFPATSRIQSNPHSSNEAPF